jgi:membrane associated rhomboid family serine protease
MHLFMNMLWLFFFGPDVERVLGTRSFFRFYLICGAGGVMATMLPYFLQGEPTNVVGASGAVMGVMVAFAVAEPDREFFLFPFPWPVNARALVMIVVVMNIISSLGGTSVSVWTHFGGMAVGYLYMKILPVFIGMKRERRRKDVKSKKSPNDKVGEAVDNIFKFDDRKRR